MDVKTGKEISIPAARSGLGVFIFFLSKIVDPLTRSGAALAGFMLAAMMFLTFVDVVGRFVFNSPIIGSYEITEFFMVIMVSFGLAYCALRKGHIRVDLLMQYTSRKANQWFNVFAYSFSFIFFVFIAWQGWLNAWSNLSTKAASVILLIPVAPFAFLMVIGAALVALVFFRDFLKSIEEVFR